MNCKNCEYGLKQSCGDFEKIICTYEEGECVKMTELEKENAELKAVERMALYSKMSDLLAKAKELLERLLITSCNSDVLNQYPNCSEVLKVRCEAEQFLKEVSE